MTYPKTEQEHPPQPWPIAKQLVSLTWPIALSMLSYSLMTAVDTLFVGRFGPEAISAVGLGGLTSFTLLTFAMGLLRSGKIIASQAVGAGKNHEIPALAVATFVVALGCSVISILLTLGAVPLLGRAFAEPAANELVQRYVAIRAVGIPMFLLATALREVSQGIGDTRGPMWASVTANLVNIPLNALFVLGWDGGVEGSAWANVVAQLLDFLILAWIRRDWLRAIKSFSKAWGRRIALSGVPLGFEMFLDVSAFSLLGFIVARLGAVEMASHQVAFQISQLTLLPIVALSESVSVLSGNAVGGAQPHRVPAIARVGIAIGLGYALLLSVPYLCAPEYIVAPFTDSRGVLRLSSLLLVMVAGFQLMFSFYCVCRAALRGMGQLKYTALVTVGAAWGCTPPLGYLFAHVFHYGVVGAWCGLSLEITLGAVLYIARLERKSSAVLLGQNDEPRQPLRGDAAAASSPFECAGP